MTPLHISISFLDKRRVGMSNEIRFIFRIPLENRFRFFFFFLNSIRRKDLLLRLKEEKKNVRLYMGHVTSSTYANGVN